MVFMCVLHWPYRMPKGLVVRVCLGRGSIVSRIGQRYLVCHVPEDGVGQTTRCTRASHEVIAGFE